MRLKKTEESLFALKEENNKLKLSKSKNATRVISYQGEDLTAFQKDYQDLKIRYQSLSVYIFYFLRYNMKE